MFGRVRPLIGDETVGNCGDISHIHFSDDDHCTLELEKLSDANPNEVPLLAVAFSFSNYVACRKVVAIMIIIIIIIIIILDKVVSIC